MSETEVKTAKSEPALRLLPEYKQADETSFERKELRISCKLSETLTRNI